MMFVGMILFIVGGILFGIGSKMKSKFQYSESFSLHFINNLFNQNIIDEQQRTNFLNMQQNEQMQFMQQQMNQLNQQQTQMLLQQMDIQNQQQEMQHFMQTGIEFGGFNTDLNLNPMQQDMLNQQNNNMNNNNFGGPGMF